MLNYLENQGINEIKKLNDIFFKMMSKDQSFKGNSEIELDLLVSLLALNEQMYLEYFFITFNKIKNEKMDFLLNLCITRNWTILIINKYINFIQLHYHNNRNVDLFNLIAKLIKPQMTYDEITKLKMGGIFPLILSYINKCDIDYYSLINILQKFSFNNTATIVNIIEKVNFTIPFANYLENFIININNQSQNEQLYNLKYNLKHILPMLRYNS
jgi:hypothetical protein